MTDDPLIDVIGVTVEALDGAGIVYAITGSIVSSIYGEPFHSQDVDFVMRMTVAQARQVALNLPQRFYRSAERLVEIARDGGIANLIDTDTGLKVDLSVIERGTFHDTLMSRRVLTSFGPDGPSYYTVTPEDIVLMKLLWRKDTKSQKQWDNALSVVRVQGVKLDWKYLYEQADALNLKDDLTAMRDEAGI